MARIPHRWRFSFLLLLNQVYLYHARQILFGYYLFDYRYQNNYRKDDEQLWPVWGSNSRLNSHRSCEFDYETLWPVTVLRCFRFASVCRQIHHASSNKNAFSTIKSPIDVGNSSNTRHLFLKSDAIYDNYKCVPLDDLSIYALYIEDR